MQHSSVFTFTIVSAFAAASPGPDVLLTIANGIRYGLKPAIIGSFGTVISHFAIIISIFFSDNRLSGVYPGMVWTIKALGVFYLTVIGLQLLNIRKHKNIADFRDPMVSLFRGNVFCQNLFVSLTNPKAWLFFVAFIPQFIVSREGEVLLQYLEIAVYFMLIELILLIFYAYVAINSNCLVDKMKTVWFDRVFGVILLLLSAHLITSQLI